jgi:adenylate kinase
MECDGRGAARGWWALTGTPGTGKSSAARELVPGTLAVELATLARATGGSVGTDGTTEVDVAGMAQFLRSHRPGAPIVVAGYLAHRLPVRRVVVLRCHPNELERRLRSRGERGHRLAENVGAEAIDAIATEARARFPARDVLEVDTTGRSPRSVARAVRALIDGRPPAARPVDWLSDPSVPRRLLELGA